MKYAHYFKFGKRHYIVKSETNRPVGVEVDVAGKKEARKMAKELGLECWNF